MAFRIWIILLAVFTFYSGLVYRNCDEKLKAGMPNEHVLAGWNLWQKKNCQSCHQFYGLGGYLGPDLTNVISDNHKGAAYAKIMIQYGNTRMPNFKLTEQEVNDLVTFLSWVDKSGKNKISDSAIHWTGTYNLKE